jgi:hypothetical protein
LSAELPPWFDNDRNPVTLWDEGATEFEMTDEERHPLGANMAVRRDVLSRMREPFDPRLGHIGAVRMAYEELNLLAKLLKTQRIVYSPAAAVDHMVDAERLTYSFMRRAYFQYGFGRARHQRLSGAPVPRRLRRLTLALRSYRFATTLRTRNSRSEQLDADTARGEFAAYFAAGKNIEMLFARTPRLSQLCARILA